jgi:heme exporter protein C
VASAWIAYMGFAMTFATSIAYIITKNLTWDDWAFASAQIGVVFCTVAITTGPMWAKSVWGVYWYWNDLKLLMTLILWLVFIAYLAIRANVEARRSKANLSGIFSVIGMICIPLSFAANRWWTTIHPTIIASEKGVIETSEMVPALVVSVFAFTFLYITLLLFKVETLKLREKVEELKQRIGD